MKKIYFVGHPTTDKGIKDFNCLAEKIADTEFYWFCYKLDAHNRAEYKYIHFVVGLDDTQLKKVIQEEMDLMVCCSHFEGFCLPIAEAILQNKPVISYQLPEVCSAYADNIEYIDCFDLPKFIERLKNIILYNNYKKDLDAAKIFVMNNYSPERVSDRLLSIIS